MIATTEFFRHAELSLASYSGLSMGLSGDTLISSLQAAGLASSQAVDFSRNWLVLDQYNHVSDPYPVYDEITGEFVRYDTETNGLSVTVFQDKSTGQRYLAIRGTDDLYDVATDTVSVAILGSTRFQAQYQSLKLRVQEWMQDGTLPRQYTVTGHSLGGFLATGLATEFSANVTRAYLYNSPGVGGVAVGNPGSGLAFCLCPQ